MKVVILAGGLGTRLSEETDLRPKPMVEIGGRPILWHIMKIYSAQGFNDFIICLGYKGYLIKEYFSNYVLHSSDVTFDLSTGSVEVHSRRSESWRVTLVDTGLNSQTAQRLERVKPYVDGTGPFMLTYGDGVADIDLNKLVSFHQSHKRVATVTAVTPPGRFGSLDIGRNGIVQTFTEKPLGDGARINGGFFVFEQGIFNYIPRTNVMLEQEPLIHLSKDHQLAAYEHNGFWHPMDTVRDKNYLEKLCADHTPPWKVW